MKDVIKFPLILIKANDEEIINYLKSTNILIKHYTKKFNLILKSCDIKFEFILKVCDRREENWIIKQYEELMDLIQTDNKIICSPFLQPKPAEKNNSLTKPT